MSSNFNPRLIWLTIFIVGIFTGTISYSSPAESAPDSKPLSQFINPDGTINLTTNFSGTLTTAGYGMELRADGTPLFLPTDQNQDRDNPLSDPPYWDNQFALSNGTFGTIYTIVVDGNGGVYVGGRFDTIEQKVASNIAKWDQHTQSWHLLASNGVEGVRRNEQSNQATVYALAWDSSTQSLFVGGFFDSAGGIETGNIARWDASINQWAAVGMVPNAGTDGEVLSLAWNDDDDILYAGGKFQTAGENPAPYIAKWVKAKNQWLPVGDVIEQNVHVLRWRDSENILYVAGEFGRVAMWSENTDLWEFLGDQNDLIHGPVFDLVWNEAAGILYVGGSFEFIGNMTVHNIAQWDENTRSWFRMGGGLSLLFLRSMVWDAETSALYVAGIADGRGALYKWDAILHNWQTITRNSSNLGSFQALGWDGTENELFVGGSYKHIEGSAIYGVAIWNASTLLWKPVGQNTGQGMVHNVGSMVSDGEGGVYMEGRFQYSNINTLYYWNPQTNTWTLIAPNQYIEINDLAFDRETGMLYMAYSNVTWPSASQVLQWDPKLQTWTVIFTLIGDQSPSIVSLLWEDQNDVLYIGTQYLDSSNVFKWHSKTGTIEALPITPVSIRTIFSMARDDENQVLYVGGMMDDYGVLKYDETTRTWDTLGVGVSGTVHKLEWNDNDNYLYAFGDFTTAGGQSTNGIAKWEEDSDQWSLFGEGATAWVSDLVWDNHLNRLYLGGSFTIEEQYFPLVWWDEITDSWGWYDSNPRGHILSIAYEPTEKNNGNFWVNGNFEVAGNVAAHHLTRQILTPLPTPTTTPTLPPTLTPGPSHTPTATLPPTATQSATPLPTLTLTASASVTASASATTTPAPTVTHSPLFLPLVQR